MATTTVLNSFLIPDIIINAGNPVYTYDFSTGLLTVDSLSQVDLNAAVTGKDDSMAATVLADALAPALKAIDNAAGTTRMKYITSVPGQAETYLMKGDQAKAFKDAGYPVDASPYPMVAAEAAATSTTTTVSADNILATKAAWVILAATIEQERIAGKAAITAAADLATLNVAKEAAITALKAI